MPPTTIHSLMPDPESLLALEPEEFAGIVLEVIHIQNRSPGTGELNRYNFTLLRNFRDYPPQYQKHVAQAVIEAWMWLEREGLIAPKPGETGNWYFLTRRGEQITDRTELENFRKGNILPRKQLHPVIAQKVWATFLRGDYDTAVFQSFKEVEVAVRRAGRYSSDIIGTDLMRKAFHIENGSLTNFEHLPAERQALSDLFAGAIGSYKNPSSHRHIGTTAEETAEMIVLASHLLRIVDDREALVAAREKTEASN